MFRRDHSLRLLGGTKSAQVIVKFRATEPARRSLSLLSTRDLAAADLPEEGPLEYLLNQNRIEAMEPLFEGAATREVSASRMFLSVREDDDLSGFNVVNFNSTDNAEDAVARLKQDARVESVHVIQERYFCLAKKKKPAPKKKAAAVGIDPLLNRQWGLVAVKLAAAQAVAGFKEAGSVVIAVIDSGVDSSHPDLKGVFVEEKSFTTGAKKDTQGHGTHVSGIIAAVRNNQLGISGVCQSKKIMSLKALGPYSGPGYYRALRYATDNGARVINLSLGGSHDPTEELLIKRAITKNVVVVAAMGNEFDEGNPISYPAAVAGVISVGATDELDRHASFSNTGAHIDLAAPGVNVLSTVPTYPTSLADGTDYEAWPGTSMATPFVAATVALLLAKKPGLTVAQITKALRKGADKVPGQTGINNEFGAGRLNVLKALAQV